MQAGASVTSAIVVDMSLLRRPSRKWRTRHAKGHNFSILSPGNEKLVCPISHFLPSLGELNEEDGVEKCQSHLEGQLKKLLPERLPRPSGIKRTEREIASLEPKRVGLCRISTRRGWPARRPDGGSGSKAWQSGFATFPWLAEPQQPRSVTIRQPQSISTTSFRPADDAGGGENNHRVRSNQPLEPAMATDWSMTHSPTPRYLSIHTETSLLSPVACLVLRLGFACPQRTTG